MKTVKKIGAALMSIVMMIALIPAAIAADVDPASGMGSVPVALNQDATTFSVSLPTTLPVAVTADHVVSTASDAQLVNNSYGPIQVKQVQVNEQNGWELVSFATDFRKVKVDAKQFGMELQGVAVETTGEADASAFQVVNGYKAVPLTYDAVVAAQSSDISETVANVVFTIGWDGTETNDTPSTAQVGNIALLLQAGSQGLGQNYARVYFAGDSNPSVIGTDADYSQYINNLVEYTDLGSGTYQLENVGHYYTGSYSYTNSSSTITIGGSSIDVNSSTTFMYIDDEGVADYYVGIENAPSFSSCDAAAYMCKDNNDANDVILVVVIGSNAINTQRIRSIEITASNREYVGYTGAENENLTIQATFVGDGNNETLAGVTYKVTTLNGAFEDCTNLESVTIPEGVEGIGSAAFSGCTNLTTISIPSTVCDISGDGRFAVGAFANCTSLTDIYYNGTEEQWNAISLEDGWDINTGSYTIHCTDGDITKS